MERNLLNDIFKIYKIEENMVNKNVVKCIFRAMKKNKLSYITGQYYNYDKDMFEYLADNYKKILTFFDFYYSLKSDIITMFDFLIKYKETKQKLIFNAFFCPGYNTKGGYKDYLGNTTTKKLHILGDLSTFLNELNINHEIHCYYCDSYVENCDERLNSEWKYELEYNRDLFYKEAGKYFNIKFIHKTSEMEIFKDENEPGGSIDDDIISSIPKNVYNSFYIANRAFYIKLGFNEEQIKDRNDKLATMYILVSIYINSIDSGIYLPMENMYDREKIIANNGTCTMYLIQRLVDKYEK